MLRGLDESTSISSRAFELYVQQKTPVEVAIALSLEAEKAINYYHEYFMLLGITEFTKAYLQVKDNPWPFINLVNLVQKARIGEGEVVELLKIANGYLPRVRLEYDRVKEEKSLLQAELNSWKAELNSIARTYQQFVDRNVALKKREDELQVNVNELEAKEDELQRTISGLKQQLSEPRENYICDNSLDPKIKQEEVISINDLSVLPLNMAVNNHPTENNEILHYPTQAEPSSRTLILDTKDLY